ncbi:diphthine--ammonia ligase [Flavobacterium sediminilitoris]|uniref:Diphthine--ammonia ligase n=1 Tax=Flavobacterium sediminilitoris TaxID=2024526 RepID=A0ABY4HK17_9FLAO|nr:MULTISPECIES: diphthine--ammonia ligase [Flavobacterium]UOX33192.1 diphthine--ammonia ligase [Flavobacterium sediminilitoris]
MKKKALFNWSSGKDSALALYKILQQNEYEILTLLTSVNKQFQRISMHGIRVELLEKQAESIGLPLTKMIIPEMPTMEIYDEIMKNTLSEFQKEGITHSIFGDIFLEDLRKYREDKLASVNFKGVFPLWKQNTTTLLQEFLSLGFKTIVVCVNEKYLDKSFVGRIIDENFIKDLPENVDVCGENGEFHTFTFDGPIFSKPIPFEIGEIVYRKYEKPKTTESNTVCNSDDTTPSYGFWYCDLI